MFNILIRTSNRPLYFNKCIKSLLQQTYENYRVIICYDDINSYNYIEKYNDERIESYYINIEEQCCLHYKYNLYCNFLMSKVESGWILFLDDDNVFINKNALYKIDNSIVSDEDMIFWKVDINNKIIYPPNFNVKYGNIDSGGFCFHSKYKHYSRWKSEKGSDFIFINTLLNSSIIFNKQMINSILLKTQDNTNDGRKMTHKTLDNFNIDSVYISEFETLNLHLELNKFNSRSLSPCLFAGFKSKEDLKIIHNYQGWVYLLITKESDFLNLKEIKRKKKIKILLMDKINQNIYLSLIKRKLFFLNYDIIAI